EIFDQAPRLTDLFFLILAREQSMLIERVINIGRRSAVERLAHFIVEMKVRLNVDTDQFELPMNQTVIGDTLSLSSVHVSRTFKVLRDEGLLESHNGNIQILDLEGLIEISGFDRNYLDSHSNWARQD
ncbi:Crp/Fnr family transcriptional regulator, partial [Methylophaga sp. UBA1464]